MKKNEVAPRGGRLLREGKEDQPCLLRPKRKARHSPPCGTKKKGER